MEAVHRVLPVSLPESSCRICYGGGPHAGGSRWVRVSTANCQPICSGAQQRFRAWSDQRTPGTGIPQTLWADACPACGEGTVYEKTPGVLVRITGQPPLAATVYHNICERALKKAILHRKNALFYKTRQWGPGRRPVHEPDLHLPVERGEPVRLPDRVAGHAEVLAACPERWMPWNYRDAEAS